MKDNLARFIKKIPGFRSGKWWKSLIAGLFYFFALLVILGILIPSTPTLALEEIGPTNKSAIVAGETSVEKPVYLIQNSEVIQSSKADSMGKFLFVLNNLEEGNFAYTVQACNSEKRKYCKTENILVRVDKTPPIKPTVTSPSELPEEEWTVVSIPGISEPDTKIIGEVEGNDLKEASVNDQGRFVIKTNLVSGENKFAIKAVDNAKNESETTTFVVSFNPKKYKAKVTRVIDGDTVEIESGQSIRYIGVDSPETVHPSKPVECYGKEASDKNKELVEGKEVILEKDVSETDKYGRLLRYIWVGEIFVNEYLVKEGFAQISTYPPDVKYQDKFLAAEKEARENKRGLWGPVCVIEATPIPAPTLTPQPTSIPTSQLTPTPPSTESTITPTPTPTPAPPTATPTPEATLTPEGKYTCDCKKTCPKMSSCEEAYYQLNVCGCKARDGDSDGVPCESICPGG